MSLSGRDRIGVLKLAGFANRVIVGWLRDCKTALFAEKLVKNALNSVGDDRVRKHSYQVLGGRPAIALNAANDLVPEDLQRRLREGSTPKED